MRDGRVALAAATLTYVLVTVLMTYPVTCRLASAPAGLNNEDAFQHLWSLWWTKKALLDLHTNPAQLTYLYHPSEPYHPMLIVSPFVQLVALPLTLASSPIVAYNVEFLLSFILTGMTTWLLCYYLTRNALASFVGGLVFAFFPNKMLHSMGHLPQMTLYLFPLYVLFLFLLLEKPDLRHALGLGLVLALSALVHIVHIAYFLIPCTLVFFLWQVIAHRSQVLAPEFLKHAALAFLLAFVLTAPLFVPFIVDRLSGALTYLQAGGSAEYSADVVNYLTPSSDHPILGSLLRRLPFPIPGHKDDETLVYVGLVALFLAIVGYAGGWRERGFWVVLGLSTAILACGPSLKIGGQPVQLAIGGREWPIPLPYALLLRLPFYEWGRIPARLLETVAFSLAVLASYGTASMLAHLRASKVKIALVAFLAALILFECVIVFPFPTGETPISSFYRQLAGDGEDYAILDIPFKGWPASNTNMYYQTVHGHRIVGGYIWRVPIGVRPMMTFFKHLVKPPGEAADIIEPLNGFERSTIMRHYEIAFVVLHKALLSPEELALDAKLLESFPAERVYEDEQIVAFRVPQVGEIGRTKPLLVVGENWYDIEPSNGRPARWMSNDGVIYAGISQGGQYELEFVAASVEMPGRVRVYVNGEEVGEFSVQEKQSYSVGPLSLQGEDWASIRFHAVEGCQVSPDAGRESDGGRCLSFLFQSVQLEPI